MNVEQVKQRSGHLSDGSRYRTQGGVVTYTVSVNFSYFARKKLSSADRLPFLKAVSISMDTMVELKKMERLEIQNSQQIDLVCRYGQLLIQDRPHGDNGNSLNERSTFGFSQRVTAHECGHGHSFSRGVSVGSLGLPQFDVDAHETKRDDCKHNLCISI
jgi:hypothetical protein